MSWDTRSLAFAAPVVPAAHYLNRLVSLANRVLGLVEVPRTGLAASYSPELPVD